MSNKQPTLIYHDVLETAHGCGPFPRAKIVVSEELRKDFDFFFLFRFLVFYVFHVFHVRGFLLRARVENHELRKPD